MEKGLAKSLAYKLLAKESVVSRNVAKRESDQWGQKQKPSTRSGMRSSRQHSVNSAYSRSSSGSSTMPAMPRMRTTRAACERARSSRSTAMGRGLAGSLRVGREGRIERLHGIEYPALARHVLRIRHVGSGLQAEPPRGKIVGLAAYGDPAILADVLLARFDRTPGSFRIRESNNLYFAPHAGDRSSRRSTWRPRTNMCSNGSPAITSAFTWSRPG